MVNLTSPGQGNYSVFLSWLIDVGAEFSAIELKDNQGYRSVVSRSKIKKDNCIMSVPSQACFYNTPQQLSDINNLFGQCSEPFNYLPVILRLALELKNPSPYWLPYLESLPTQIDTLTNHYPLALKDALKVSASWPYVLDTTYEYNEEVKQLRNLNHSQNDLPKGLFYWARTLFFTRSFDGTSYGWDEESCMIPLIDMCNHASENNVLLTFNQKDSRFEAMAKRDIDPGEEVTITYGSYTNAYFLANYGFAAKNNPNKSLVLSPRSLCESRFPERSKFSQCFSAWLDITKKDTVNFLALLTQCRALSAEYSVCEAWSKDPNTLLTPRDLRQECKAFELILMLCQQRRDQIFNQSLISQLCQTPENDASLSKNEKNIQSVCLDELDFLCQLEACCHAFVSNVKSGNSIVNIKKILSEYTLGALYLSLPDAFHI